MISENLNSNILKNLTFINGGRKMSYEIVTIFPHELLTEEHNDSCISLYQPTYRQVPGNEQNSIRFKNLVHQIELSLKETASKQEVEERMQPFKEIAESREFWRFTKDGLAVFASADRCIVYILQRSVKEFSVVANSFHIKPLIRVYQSADRYHLLGINRKQFAMFEGTRYQVEKIDMDPSILNTFKDAIGEDFDDKIVQATGSGPNNEVKMHGQGSKKDIIQKETKKFFRVADNEVMTHFSQPMQLPVFLVALDENHALFQQVSKNKHVRKQGIKADYQSMSLKELQNTAWDILEPLYIEKTYDLVQEFENAKARNQASDDIAQIVRAASEGRIRRVLIEADKVYPGQVDKTTGELKEARLDHPEIDDVLDDITELVFQQNGEVVVIPNERMPSNTGAAATYRY